MTHRVEIRISRVDTFTSRVRRDTEERHRLMPEMVIELSADTAGAALSKAINHLKTEEAYWDAQADKAPGIVVTFEGDEGS